MRVFLSILVALVIVALAGSFYLKPAVAPVVDSGAPGKLKLTATIFPLADWLREIGGDDAEVHCLVSGAGNPHHFDPTIKDAARVTQARALFAVGLGLDPWAENLARNASTSVVLFETGKWIAPRKINETKTIEVGSHAHAHKDEHDHEHRHEGNLDPHYWLDPARAITVVQRMADELGKLDPPNREKYSARAAAYVETLKALNSGIESEAKLIPPGRQIVTFHNAYGYLLERLNIKLAAVIQASPGVEPGTRETARAVNALRQIGQQVVFQEPMSSPAAAKMIAAELGARIELLDPMDSESSDAGKTYLERMRHNIRVLANAASGKK